MKKIIAAAALCFALSVSAYANQNLEMKSENGKVEFSAKGPLVRVNGKGPGAYGTLELKEGKVSGELKLNLKDLETGISLRDDHMKNKYLEISKEGYDKATLFLTDVEMPKDLKGKTKFSGMMLLHGVKKPVNGTVKVKGVKKGNLPLTANFKLRFSDFNIPLPSFKLVSVGEEIKISVQSKANVKSL